MTTAVAVNDVERFRSVLARLLALHFDDARLGSLAEVLRRRVEANGGINDGYLIRLEAGDISRRERQALAQELTVPETYFFRNLEQFHAFADVALPGRLQARPNGRPLQILSAGCASGEEAYSLAILVRDRVSDAEAKQVSIRAVDINPRVIERASRGQYSEWSLRGMPADVQRRWFRPRGRDHLLEETIRSMVVFEERNLAEEDPSFWQPGAFDIIFCRNVIMYFTPGQAEALVTRMARSLAPQGFLFLGHAETLRGLSQQFHLLHTHGAFYYQRKDEADEARPGIEAMRRDSPRPAHGDSQIAEAIEEAGSWVQAIRGASERIQRLTQGPSAVRAVRALPAGAAPGERGHHGLEDLGLALELLRRERFGEALAHVRSLPAESARDPDVLLLEAVLLIHSGNLAEAETVCSDLLVRDEMSAGAHYLMALCREHAGDRQGAIDHDQVSIYLDPGFSIPHLHLGLLGRRARDRPLARRELGQALVLLQREDSSRLLLFGGGFSREALIALCRGELAACGETP